MDKKIILVDMDGVIANFSLHIYTQMKTRYPEYTITHPDFQSTHYFSKQHPEYQEEILAMYREKGFFENIPPIPGAIEGLNHLRETHHVILCTAPIDSETCEEEKIRWKNKYFGTSLPIILANDKSFYKADYLIDDNPYIGGHMRHTNPWEHIIYDQPYNRHISDQRRMTWANAQTDIPELWNIT